MRTALLAVFQAVLIGFALLACHPHTRWVSHNTQTIGAEQSPQNGPSAPSASSAAPAEPRCVMMQRRGTEALMFPTQAGWRAYEASLADGGSIDVIDSRA